MQEYGNYHLSQEQQLYGFKSIIMINISFKCFAVRLRFVDMNNMATPIKQIMIGHAQELIGLIDEAGKRVTKNADKSGCVKFLRPASRNFLVQGVHLFASTQPEREWVSHFAAFTVLDARAKP